MPFQSNDGTPSGFIPTNPYGVWGDAGRGNGNGVIGSSKYSSGVAGLTSANDSRAAGVFGSGARIGVAGLVVGAVTSPSLKCGVYGSGAIGGEGAWGVFGESISRTGVEGHSVTSTGVHGFSDQQYGVYGSGHTGVGAWGTRLGLLAGANDGGLAALFLGDVQVTGTIFKPGGGFRIDHPLDPENRYLSHSFVESPEMKNFYDGIAVCDRSGEAVVELPEWFVTLNENFRYQLTPIGAPAPDLHIAEEVSENRFRIAGGRQGTKVSWQVTGVRRDRWANANRIVVEEEKDQDMRGRYLHPELWEQPRERGIGAEYRRREEEE